VYLQLCVPSTLSDFNSVGLQLRLLQVRRVNSVGFNFVVYNFVTDPQETDRKWTQRKRGQNKVIGRILRVNIHEKERYFLRLLLLHTKGARSFNELHTVGGQHYESFYEVAKLRGLVLDEDIWRTTLQEACGASMPYQPKELFAFICLFSTLCDNSNLRFEYKDNLCEDFLSKTWTSMLQGLPIVF
jgi:hypothetical protein